MTKLLSLSADSEAPYKRLVEDWKGCEECDLCKHRKQVVHVGGRMPCDILFIGEGPGKSEDHLGFPFVGEAGHKLQEIIREAGLGEYTWGTTNVVACVPKRADKQGIVTIKAPKKDEIASCRDRLLQTLALAQPQALVYVGKIAGDHPVLDERYSELPRTFIVHPASIIRNPGRETLLTRQCIHKLTALKEQLDGLRS